MSNSIWKPRVRRLLVERLFNVALVKQSQPQEKCQLHGQNGRKQEKKAEINFFFFKTLVFHLR